MRTILQAADSAVYFSPLIYAAFTDSKYRVIKDRVHIVFLLLAVFNWQAVPLSARVAGFLLPAVCMLLLYMSGVKTGGGDFKHIISMGFSFGIYNFAAILALTVFTAVIYSAATKRNSVPLAVFTLIGYAVYFILQGGDFL